MTRPTPHDGARMTQLATMTLTVEVRVGLSFWDALKCRVAGPEVSAAVADTVRRAAEEIGKRAAPDGSGARE